MIDGVVVAGPGDARKPVILVVEDDVLVRFTTAEWLRDSGFDVLEAVNAAEALALLKTGHPLDCVITDIRMPGPLNGVQLASKLKSLRPNLPVALLSSHLDDDAHEADLFIAKPYLPSELVEAVERLIGAEWRNSSSSPSAS